MKIENWILLGIVISCWISFFFLGTPGLLVAFGIGIIILLFIILVGVLGWGCDEK